MDQTAALHRLQEFVRDKRRAQRLTQDALATLAGISKPTISRIEQGTLAAIPKLSTLEKLSKALDISFDLLQDLVTKGVDPGVGRVRRVLIAVDDRGFGSLLMNALGRKSFAPVHAFDGERALQIINYALPDVAIIAAALPVIEGRHLANHLRADLGYEGALVYLGEEPIAAADAWLDPSTETFGVRLICDVVRTLAGIGVLT